MAEGVAARGAPYGPIGIRVVFENDRVRVWEVELAPGETLPMHFHDRDYALVALTDGSTVGEREDGRRETSEHPVGEVTWRAAPHAHALTNVRPKRYRNGLIELKG